MSEATAPSGAREGDGGTATRLAARLAARVARATAWLLAVPATLWAAGALHFDVPAAGPFAAPAYLAAVAALAWRARGPWRRAAVPWLGALGVAAWWATLAPSHDRPWQPDVARLPWAEVEGDVVTLHGVRRCDYRTELDFTPRWETRVVRLSSLTGVDIALATWGSDLIAHPILSFQFADAPPVCISIEARREVGEGYSALGGLYRRFELIYVVADERDVLRLRTNFRQGESVRLYRARTGDGRAVRARFLEYLGRINDLRERPRWYHAVATNCTTSIRAQQAAEDRIPWDWRILLNGRLDEMMHAHGHLADDGLGFAALRRAAVIDDAARAAADDADFSARIRAGRPGFALARVAGDEDAPVAADAVRAAPPSSRP